jgi:hypothetical protein
MSETEHNRGTLKLVYQGDDIEGGAEIVCDLSGYIKSQYHDSFVEALNDEGYRKYYISGDCIYEVSYSSVDDDGDIYLASKENDGTISFTTRYYNGGCSFNDALDTAIERLIQ